MTNKDRDNEIGSDRRASTRLQIDMWVEGTTADGDCYFQRSANLSIGGLYLDRAVPHATGTRIMLKFVLPGEEYPIKVLGEILSHHDEDGLGMGVRFLNITEDQQKKIWNFIEKNIKTE